MLVVKTQHPVKILTATQMWNVTLNKCTIILHHLRKCLIWRNKVNEKKILTCRQCPVNIFLMCSRAKKYVNLSSISLEVRENLCHMLYNSQPSSSFRLTYFNYEKRAYLISAYPSKAILGGIFELFIFVYSDLWTVPNKCEAVTVLSVKI